MKLRWKKHPRATGLQSVGAGNYVASDYHNGAETYATVYPLGGNWRMSFRGWYFVAEVGGEKENTSRSPMMSEQDCKDKAAAWVKERLEKKA